MPHPPLTYSSQQPKVIPLWAPSKADPERLFEGNGRIRANAYTFIQKEL